MNSLKCIFWIVAIPLYFDATITTLLACLTSRQNIMPGPATGRWIMMYTSQYKSVAQWNTELLVYRVSRAPGGETLVCDVFKEQGR